MGAFSRNGGLLPSYRTIDGTDNNLDNDSYNPYAGSEEIRYTPPDYTDGYSAMIDGPNPRTISNIMSSGPHADDHDPTGLSGWGYVFGQFIDHDLDLTHETGPDISVQVPAGDPWLPDGTVIPISRDQIDYSTGNAINSVSGWLDLSQVYGSDAANNASLRAPDGAHMLTSDGDNLPIVNGQFVAGDERVMENPELSGNTLMFVREHNFQVDRLQKLHPNWSSDQLYEQAKAITNAEYQNVIYSEFLPSLGIKLSPYTGYNSGVDPRISMEFSMAAFRFGHSTVSDEQTKIDNSGNVLSEQSLSEAFLHTPQIDEANGGLDALLRSLGSDGAQALDVYAVDGLRNTLIAPPDAVDLIATDIQRERDAGLGSLNETRIAMGLQPYHSFSEVTSDPVTAANLQIAYGSIDNLDLFMGGLAEDHVAGSDMGQTFGMIIADQFERLRDGDAYWWQNEPFDAATTNMIANTTLSDLIMRDTDTGNMQQAAFTTTERHTSDTAAADPNAPQLIIGIDADGAQIVGGSANDTLVAGNGLDQLLTGGCGSDLFVFNDSGHNATITDFNTTFDQIEFVGDAPTGQPVQLRDTSGGALLTFNGNNITLAGVAADQVSSSNLMFLDSNAIATSHGLVPGMA